MAYETVIEKPAGFAGYYGPGFLGAPLGAPTACPPIRFECDCHLPGSKCKEQKKALCDRILGAIKLAKKAADRLEKKPLSAATLALFNLVFDQSPTDHWELPGQPTKTMQAGAMVAQRFRMVAKELEKRDTLYRCVPATQCQLSRGGSPHCYTDRQLGIVTERQPTLEVKPKDCHPTDTMVIDAVAIAVLCQNTVLLCPQFWTLKKEWQEGTILHEMFHLCFGLTCAWFQHDQKERKRNNANCYEVFAVSGVGTPDPASVAACKATTK